MLKRVLLFSVLILLFGCKDKQVYEKLEAKYQTFKNTEYSSYEAFGSDADKLKDEFEIFLTKYPKSRYYNESNERFRTLTETIDKVIEESKEFEDLGEQESNLSYDEALAVFQRFIDKYPNSIKKSEVEAKIGDFKYKVFEEALADGIYDIENLNRSINYCESFAKEIEKNSTLYRDKALEKKEQLEQTRLDVYSKEVLSFIPNMKEDAELQLDNEIRNQSKSLFPKFYDENFSYEFIKTEANLSKVKLIYNISKTERLFDTVENEANMRIALVYAIQGDDLVGVKGFEMIDHEEY